MPRNGLLIAFFQVNTTGAEALCELLRSLVGATKETVLLDVCCGTGTLGLSLASSVKRLIGIEMCAPAVEDARANAARNGITNALFIAKKAEEATLSVLENLSAAEKRSLVAIVDPPRAGLHTDVLKALRGCLPLTKILFVACHAPSFVANSVVLCRPASKSFLGAPFAPTRAYALDLFPHTQHCELITVLERPPPQPPQQPQQPQQPQPPLQSSPEPPLKPPFEGGGGGDGQGGGCSTGSVGA